MLSWTRGSVSHLYFDDFEHFVVAVVQKFVEACSVHDTVCYTIHLWRNSNIWHMAYQLTQQSICWQVMHLVPCNHSQVLFHSLVKLL